MNYDELYNELKSLFDKYCFEFHELKGIEPFILTEEQERRRQLKVDKFNRNLSLELKFIKNKLSETRSYYYILEKVGIQTMLEDRIFLAEGKGTKKWKVI